MQIEQLRQRHSALTFLIAFTEDVLLVVALLLVRMFHPHANDELVVEMTAEFGLVDEDRLPMAIERRGLRRRNSALARLLRQQRILTADRG